MVAAKPFDVPTMEIVWAEEFFTWAGTKTRPIPIKKWVLGLLLEANV
jgi:hypothetical protein